MLNVAPLRYTDLLSAFYSYFAFFSHHLRGHTFTFLLVQAIVSPFSSRSMNIMTVRVSQEKAKPLYLEVVW